MLEDDRDRDHVVHKKKMRYWLGSLRIPFSTIYFKSKIEGTFKIDTPNMMLGYTRDPKNSRIQSFMGGMETNSILEAPLKEASYLSLFVSLEPNLLVPDAFRENYDSIESMELLEKAVTWATGFQKKFPTREFRPIVMNTDGKSVLVTRYIRSIPPPDSLVDRALDSQETMVTICFKSL